jgi:tyrosine-protein phosphatase YwqE
MFGFFKKKEVKKTQLQVLPFEALVTDMHSHILPGIDDGAQTVEDSILLIDTLYKKGFRNFICTPHIYNELYPNSPATIKAAFELLEPVAKEKFPDVNIRYAAEYFMDEVFDENLEKGEKLLTVAQDYVLVEHSFMQAPFDLKEKIFNIQMAGYTPIIAHPERYEFYMQNKKGYDSLYDAGCVFQINLLSLMGYYGKAPLELSKYLIERGYVKMLGSDIHKQAHVDAYNVYNGYGLILDLLDRGELLNNTLY